MSTQACRVLARTLGVDADALVEEWAERAAIREFEGGQARADAERDALDDVSALHRKGPQRAPSLHAATAKKRVP